MLYADLGQLSEWEKKNTKFSQYIKRNSSSDFSRVQFPGRGRTGTDRYIIKTEINLVKVREEQNNKLYQQARGSITLPAYDGAPVRITLGKDADRSTFVHELGHLYLWHMKHLAGLDAVQNRASWNGPASRWNS